MWRRCRGFLPLCSPWLRNEKFQLGCGAGAAGVALGPGGGAGAVVSVDGGAGSAWPTGTIVTFFSTTGVSGLSRLSRSTRVIVFTTSTDDGSHCPKIV